jgi:adenine-specific DNA-methyltransferase
MVKKQKLELTWIGKENHPKLEPRILIEDPEKSYHAGHRVTDKDIFDNILIHGDNLLALKALEQEYTGKVKCIYIDPPYNTGSAFEHYDDGVEHSLWLSLIRDRLEILKKLLSDDGSIWISIDDHEGHYLKIACDEIFGRSNFICDIAWEKRYSPPPDTKEFGYIHDHILCYRKTPLFQRNLLPMTEDQTGRYKNPDSDPRGPWKAMDYTCRYSAEERPNLYYPIIQPQTGEKIWPKKTRVWASSKEVHQKNVKENRIWWGKNGKNQVPALKNFFSEISQGMMPMSLWKYSLAGHTQDAMKEMLNLFGEDPFATPKPEKLVRTIIQIATKKNDIVLDSFLGSGTSAAVAHKMGRRWIGIELGDHCYSHCIPRIKKVIDGEDQGGISKAVNWKGGGGFRFYELGPSLIKKDEWGNPVINPEFNPVMLAEAMCKLEGFSYAPSDEVYWIHGHSTEADFIWVTTQFISRAMLEKLSNDVGETRSLLICCSAFKCDPLEFSNLTIKKIPNAILKKCEWGHDDYSLEVQNLLDAPVVPDPEPVGITNKKDRKFGKGRDKQMTLFGDGPLTGQGNP